MVVFSEVAPIHPHTLFPLFLRLEGGEEEKEGGGTEEDIRDNNPSV